jgi:hypothetical protein
VKLTAEVKNLSEEKGVVSELLDKITGKESTLSIDLDDVGIELGENRKVTLNGKINLSIVTLK